MVYSSQDTEGFSATDTESDVFWAVLDAGALTTRTIIKKWGPKPNWLGLVKSKRLQEVNTIYGSVITVGDIGHEEVERRFPDEVTKLIYLKGPSAIADRAYQQDALITLTQQGYTIYAHEYKRASPMVMRHRDSRRPWTHQIVSTCLRVPEIEAQLLASRWGQRVKQIGDIIGVEAHEHRLGYPYLYATISGGGKSQQWVEAMYKRAATWSSDWRSPMLIVVPDLALHRNILRRVAAEQKANEDFDRKSAAPSYLGSYPVLRFIEQPLPRMVTHKSR